jgi:hypothetical protein
VPSGTQATNIVEPSEDDQAVWILDDGSKSPFGPVERQLRADIGELKLAGQLSGTVTATAFNLARTLDRGAGMATAAVARELREYIRLIEGAAGDDADTSSHRADLSTPV